ncbi:MAG: hypothetical protein VX681_14520 [Myxococcota bacterium]|nr:hypothetical protein [Myxococcota bacterium]
MPTGFERPTPGTAIAALLLALGALAYPLLGDQAIERLGVRVTAGTLLAAVLIAMVVRLAVERRPLRLLAQNAGALVLLGLATGSADRTYLYLFPALVNLYLAAIFAGSVASRASIVERGARLVQPYLPSFTLAYCRRLTLLWAAFFAANCVWIGVLAFGPTEPWRRYTVVVYPGLIAMLCAIEFLVRKSWFRYYGDGPLDRTLAGLFPPEVNERGRRSQRYISALRAAGYGPGGARRGEPLDASLVPDVLHL